MTKAERRLIETAINRRKDYNDYNHLLFLWAIDAVIEEREKKAAKKKGEKK